MIGFLLKILLFSGLISIAIKLAAPVVTVTATPGTVLTIVLLPSILMAIALGWRWQQRSDV